jgi:release factor glutamine methyltransferase
VFAEEEARMIIEAAGGRTPDIDRMVARRCAGEPLELVVGYAEIADVRVTVHPGVFVPRRRSEPLISSTAAALARITSHDPVVVDLGCGSGALLVAVLSRVRCTAYAIDNSPAAVECARENLAGSGAYVIEGTGLSGLPGRARGEVDVIMANLPYVPTDAISLLPREARLYEPRSTLDGGPDGLTPLEAALAEAATWLRRDGHYLGELHQSQVDAATLAADRLGFDCATTVDAEDGTAVIDLTPRATPHQSAFRTG